MTTCTPASWWCSRKNTQINPLTQCPALIFLLFFFFCHPSLTSLLLLQQRRFNISKSKFVIKMSPGQTWFGKSGWGLVRETNSALTQQLLSRSGQQYKTVAALQYSRYIPNMSLSSCNTPFPRTSCSHQVTAVTLNSGKSRESHRCVGFS